MNLPQPMRAISDEDVPERGWLRTGVFLSAEQIATVAEAKRHPVTQHLDEDGRGYTLHRSYLLYVAQWAKAAGLPNSLTKFDVADDGEILIARWHLPGDGGLVLEQEP